MYRCEDCVITHSITTTEHSTQDYWDHHYINWYTCWVVNRLVAVSYGLTAAVTHYLSMNVTVVITEQWNVISSNPSV